MSAKPASPCCIPVAGSDCCPSAAAASAPPNLDLYDQVRRAYGAIARVASGECAPASGCCGAPAGSTALGYDVADLAALPPTTDLGLGCGNPLAEAQVRAGETVLDLGSGAGIDCLLAARLVGTNGRVIGVDMTPEMLAKARANAVTVGATNVEFRLGVIEHLPLADDSVDVVISNCVVNLSPDQGAVFREAFRVLKPGGRLRISDVVAHQELPAAMRASSELACACIGNAATMGTVLDHLTAAGFIETAVAPKDASKVFIKEWAPGSRAEDYVVSALITGDKPRA